MHLFGLSDSHAVSSTAFSYISRFHSAPNPVVWSLAPVPSITGGVWPRRLRTAASPLRLFNGTTLNLDNRELRGSRPIAVLQGGSTICHQDPVLLFTPNLLFMLDHFYPGSRPSGYTPPVRGTARLSAAAPGGRDLPPACRLRCLYLPEVAFGPGSPLGLRYPGISHWPTARSRPRGTVAFRHARLAAYPSALPGTVRLTWHSLYSLCKFRDVDLTTQTVSSGLTITVSFITFLISHALIQSTYLDLG